MMLIFCALTRMARWLAGKGVIYRTAPVMDVRSIECHLFLSFNLPSSTVSQSTSTSIRWSLPALRWPWSIGAKINPSGNRYVYKRPPSLWRLSLKDFDFQSKKEFHDASAKPVMASWIFLRAFPHVPHVISYSILILEILCVCMWKFLWRFQICCFGQYYNGFYKPPQSHSVRYWRCLCKMKAPSSQRSDIGQTAC